MARGYNLPVPDLPFSVYDRPDIALANLFSGNVEGAGRALVAPSTLSPREAQKMYQRLGIKRSDSTVLDTIMKVATNPLFVIGAVMALKWPIPLAKNLLPFTETAAAHSKALAPLSRFISSGLHIFRGTWVGRILEKVQAGAAQDKSKYTEMLRAAFEKYEKASGGVMSKHKLHKLWAHAEKLDDMSGSYVAGLKAEYPEELAKVMKQMGLKDVKPLFNPIKMSPAETNLLKEIRPALDAMFDDAERMRKELQSLDVVITPFSKKANYLPHAMVQKGSRAHPTIESLIDTVQARARKAGGGLAPFARKRYGWLLPDLNVVDGELAQYVNPQGRKLLDAVISMRQQATAKAVNNILTNWKPGMRMTAGVDRALKKAGIEAGLARIKATEWNNIIQQSPESRALVSQNATSWMSDMKSMIPQYSMDMEDVLSTYVHRWSLMKNWKLAKHQVGWVSKATKDAKGNVVMEPLLDASGKKVPQMVGGTMNALDKAIPLDGLSPAQIKMLDDRYIPLLQGRKVGAFDVAWQEQTFRTANWLDRPEVKAWAKNIPGGERARKFIYEGITKPSASGGVGSSLTSYFYLTTLGLNPASPMKNLLQPILTTGNVVESKHMLRGFSRSVAGFQKYVRARMSGMTDIDAMTTAFPDFMSTGLATEPMTREMITGRMMGLEKIALTGGARKINRVKELMMGMFTHSERWNRIWTFYAGQTKAAAEGFAIPEATQFAERLVQLTQFPGGVMGKPYALLGLPAPLRQYLHFPMRYLEFLRTTTRMGPEQTLDLGTLGRTLMASTGLYHGAKAALGIDVSQGLMFGALPLPQIPGSPFYPFPVVPPAVSVAGGVAQAAFTGETKPLEAAAALVVPGGVELRRMYKALHPKYADYSGALPDGRIPVYNDTKSLVNYQTPEHLIMRAAGIYPSETSEEWATVEYMSKQRDQIREFRRNYMDAIFQNDFPKARRIQADFTNKYPDLPPLEVKKGDILSYRRRKEMTRVQRILQGFTKEYRGMFEGMYRMALPGHIVNESVSGGDLSQFNYPRTYAQPNLFQSSALPAFGVGQGNIGQMWGVGY